MVDVFWDFLINFFTRGRFLEATYVKGAFQFLIGSPPRKPPHPLDQECGEEKFVPFKMLCQVNRPRTLLVWKYSLLVVTLNAADFLEYIKFSSHTLSDQSLTASMSAEGNRIPDEDLYVVPVHWNS